MLIVEIIYVIKAFKISTQLYSNTERDHAYIGLFGPCFPDFFSFIIQAIFFLIEFKTIFVFSNVPSFKTTSRHAPVGIFLAFATLSC